MTTVLALRPRPAIGFGPAVRLPASTRPKAPALETVERGPQGRPGPAGDFGYVRYGEMMGTAPLAVEPDTDMPFLVREPRAVTDMLKAPFGGFAFLDGSGVLRCRKAGDSYLLSVRLSVMPQVIGGWFSVGVLIAGNVSGLAGPTSSRQVALSGAAGSTFRFDEVFQVFPSAGFAANGARLVMRSSVPAILSNDVLFVTPVVAAR